MTYPYYGYQPMYNQPMQDQLKQMKYNQMNTDERIWVQGQNAAEAYLVAPNGFVRLWDSSKPVFYEKRADPSGRPYMETFEYARKGTEMPKISPETDNKVNLYVTEIEALKTRLEAIEKKLEKENENVSKSNADDTAVQSV